MVSIKVCWNKPGSHESWWRRYKIQPRTAACNQLAGPALHMVFIKQELIPTGKAEVGSLLICSRQIFLLNPSVIIWVGTGSKHWPGPWKEYKKKKKKPKKQVKGVTLLWFMMADVFSSSSHTWWVENSPSVAFEGSLEKALTYRLDNCPNNYIWW